MYNSSKGNKNKVPKITEAEYEEYLRCLKGENTPSSDTLAQDGSSEQNLQTEN